MELTKVQVKPTENSSVHELERKCFVAQILKLLLFLMRTCGFIYTSTRLDLKENCSCGISERQDAVSQSQKRQNKCWGILQFPYIVSINLLMLGNTIKFVYCSCMTGNIGYTVQSQLGVNLSITLATTYLILLVYLVQFSKKLLPFLYRICAIQNRYSLKIAWCAVGLNRYGIRCLVLFCTIRTVFLFLMMLLEVTEEMFKVKREPVACPVGKGNIAVNLLFKLWFSMAVGAALLVTFLCAYIFTGFCNITGHLFLECSKRLQRINEDSVNSSAKSLRAPIRGVIAFHQDVCDVVDQGNDLFKYFVLAIYIMAVPSICISANALVKTDVGSEIWTLSLFYALVLLILLLFIVYKAASINTKALECLQEVFKITFSDESGNNIKLASFFVMKLSELPTGMTLMDMFIITKEHILTLLGLLVTYSLIVYQMDTFSVVKEMACNNTLTN